MKKALFLLCLSILLSSCGASGWESAGRRNAELVVFADASLTDALEAVAERYRQNVPWIRTRFLFASSGDLSRQIRDGAACDVFLSATAAPMDALDGAFRGDPARNPDNVDMLLQDSRVNLAENQVVLAAPVGNPNGIRSFAHMSAVMRRNGLLLATANEFDPLGVCAQRIFDYYGIDKGLVADGFALAADAREAVVRVRSGAADGGILYRTDADGLFIVETADASVCGAVTYCGAVLSGSAYPLAASAFLEYLTGSEASQILTLAGFAPLYGETAEEGESWEAALPEEPEPETDWVEEWT